jgi:hypothetical protein
MEHPSCVKRLFIPDYPLAQNPFALSLPKGRSWFDKLTTNGFLPQISPNGQSGFMPVIHA